MSVSAEQKIRARSVIATRVRSGDLKPPKNCPRCGKPVGHAADGRSLMRWDHSSGYSDNNADKGGWTCVVCDGKSGTTRNHLAKHPFKRPHLKEHSK